MTLQPLDPDYESKVRESFARQQFMAFIGAVLFEVRPGYCEIHLPYKKDLSQQHGFFHGGVIGTIADNCGGYAAFILMVRAEMNSQPLTIVNRAKIRHDISGVILSYIYQRQHRGQA
jgi:acyl-coenzyme A thioesterase PaaI-like protein